MGDTHSPDVQVIASVVIRSQDGRVLLVRYDPEDERWWLPGTDLVPYEHPDEAVQRLLKGFGKLKVAATRLSHVESFQGRRGWHIVFHYVVDAEGEPDSEQPTGWHPAAALPATAHGNWEKSAIERALG